MDRPLVLIANSIYVQFADFDGTENHIADVPLRALPSVGDKLNVKHNNMTYFLEVESFTHFVDCTELEREAHSVTIDCKLLNSRPTYGSVG